MPPDMDAVSVFDARLAAADGSRAEFSVRVLPSCIVLGIYVGELFLGVELRPSFLEKVRVKLVFSGTGWVIITGELTSCW